jgi:crossover junction endodeoxyribonuclease RuvC
LEGDFFSKIQNPANTKMIILGIDPGTAIMGYGLVESGAVDSEGGKRGQPLKPVAERLRMVEYGALYTPANMPLFERLPMLYDGLVQIIAEYKPQSMAIEELFFTNNARTAISVAQARGVAVLAGAHAHLKMAEYTPLQVKQAVVGYGKATKEQVQSMVRILLEMDHTPRPDDAADALAIAICHIHSSAYEDILLRGQ